MPDGAPVLRPVVPIAFAGAAQAVLGVADSGSPVSVANADLFRWLGIDVAVDAALYEIPLTIGGAVETMPVFRVDLQLHSPDGVPPGTVTWQLHLGARRRWRLPFAILLGQRGWFDQFPTRIDHDSVTVELPG